MLTEWFRGLKTPQEKDERRELVKAHAPVLEVLKEILEKQLADKLKVQQSKTAYGSPAWPYEQADSNGEQRALTSVVQLLDLTKES